MDVVKDNLKSVEIEEKVDENVREQNLRDENYHYNIKLNIQKDNINENEINTVVPKIRTKLKYKVSAHYDNTTGLIDGITINETE